MLTALCSLLFAATLPNTASHKISKEELLFNELNDGTLFHHQRYLPGNCPFYSKGPNEIETNENKIIEKALFFLEKDSKSQASSSNYWNPWMMRELANYAVLKRNPTLLKKITEYYIEFFQTFHHEKEPNVGVEDIARKNSDIEKMKAALYSMEMKNR